MSRYTLNHAPQMTTDAAFRTFCSNFSAALASIGLVKVAAANDINWTTITKPSAAWTLVTGNETWRFNDAMQSTDPIYFLLYFGIGGDSLSPYIVVNIYFGDLWAPGGAIGVSGPALISQSSSSSTSYPTYLSSDGSGFVVSALHGRAGYYGATVVVERTRNNAGVPDGRGVQMASMGSSPTTQNTSRLFTHGNTSTQYAGTNCVPPLTGTGSIGADVRVYPVRPMSREETNPFVLVAGYTSADLPTDAQYSVTRWDGLTKNYLATSERRANAPGYAPASASGTLIYWEP